MTEPSYSNEFPMKRVPQPHEVTPEYLAEVTELMAKTRRAVAPNPLAQAMHPPMRPAKRLDHK